MDDVIGDYGLVVRNERGGKLIELAQLNNMLIGCTWFKQHMRCRYAWKSPDKKTQNHIDYILIKKRFRDALSNKKTTPGTYIDSELRGQIIVRLKLEKKNIKTIKPKQEMLRKFLKNT